MSEVYEFIDKSHKKDENCLTVDFYFDSDIQKELAIAMIGLPKSSSPIPVARHRALAPAIFLPCVDVFDL